MFSALFPTTSQAWGVCRSSAPTLHVYSEILEWNTVNFVFNFLLNCKATPSVGLFIWWLIWTQQGRDSHLDPLK